MRYKDARLSVGLHIPREGLENNILAPVDGSEYSPTQ